jgi:hypothetical protein
MGHYSTEGALYLWTEPIFAIDLPAVGRSLAFNSDLCLPLFLRLKNPG